MEIRIKTEYIKLGQFLKFSNILSSGGDVKGFLQNQKVYVNGELESRRGRKLYPNDSILINSIQYVIKGDRD
ncbi:S4 domain-containing protein YaaA [Malacoplasma iowae]|uniref:S4 domain-containing protein YaaA n=1 Tax=Malacoplasma iowae TaxID=2116 RepID=UPI003872FDF2|nr:S4 domain-containing protein YaaA [Malacoplasma iowae]